LTIIHLQMYNYLHQINKQMGLKMTKQMTVTELKNLMNLSGWTHEQVITINKEYDYNGHVLEGIAEVVSRNPNVPFEIHFNEGFKYNVEKDELTTQKDDSLYGIWWFTPELEIVDNEGEKIDSWDLDKQGFKPDFSQVDYSEVIANAKKSQE
jgi:hypothetical protein